MEFRSLKIIELSNDNQMTSNNYYLESPTNINTTMIFCIPLKIPKWSILEKTSNALQFINSYGVK